ncbi:putative AAA+ superfamily ATPase [Sphingobium sp. B1D7B]|uniref:ATP-binding protein n=1 Tax=Sphingobium sp. B1D7B TaxID=2940578 RepID=UPI0022241B4C|nr:ATP-binding protein [Sphingobium sp. B1D7B]MCW2406080.1 putative AAA+ superfamily ATPase [Sphingobium sp. B1D7B]
MNSVANQDLLVRLVEALERLAPPPRSVAIAPEAEGYVWRADALALDPVATIARVDLDLLRGIERQRDALLANTLAFAEGQPANNALLWGARGTGKSSLVKAVHAEVNRALDGQTAPVALVEVQREDIGSLGKLLAILAGEHGRRFILFCDDLSFDHGEGDYKSLKALLDGGIAGRPSNVIIYATSNRRHLLARDIVENERATAIHPGEAIEEKVSLSDRFGLWLGFHAMVETEYLDIVASYADRLGIGIDRADLAQAAREWALARGSRSGRTAWQFIQHVRGQGTPASR